ncbi:MAG: Holliday junction branch migration protein RuvA [Spirochaetae bacterium HGW-Spirochaetae-1]|jgi:Holliday junction DNA helicase RuvA|nr:MAG: Holliday junction branch migration protein RuvA [Spirochaetae bacterium HGW-Spirochaetae-1]
MIAKLTGKIDELKPMECILDVGGVGYQVHIPLSTYETIQGKEDITLFIYTLHREDQMKLFGFSTQREKELFTVLLNISGIGPSMALSLLSGISIEDLVRSVQNDDSSRLVKIPGIGKAKAEKLIFELKRKLKKIESIPAASGTATGIRNDALEALVSLGFDEARAAKVIDGVREGNPEATLETVIKAALRQFSA